MELIFWGLFFAYLDFNLILNGHTVGLLPDFVGYILIYKGLSQLRDESPKFAKARPWALGLAIFTGLLYALRLLAVSVQVVFLAWVLGALFLAAGLVVTYWIVCGVQDIERARVWDLQGAHLRTVWQAFAALTGICYVFNLVPIVGKLAGLAGVIIALCFLAAFYRTKKRYLPLKG